MNQMGASSPLDKGQGPGRPRLVAVPALLTVIALIAAILFRDHVRTLASLHKVDDYPLYVMHSYVAYGLDEFLLAGVQPTPNVPTTERMLAKGWACSCFSARTAEGHVLVGRNFDWYNRPTLILFTHSSKGYDSASMVDISYLGFGTAPPGWVDRLRLLDAPYIPFDGLNEVGLAVGMMAVPQAQPSQDPHKVTIDSLTVIRLLLDRARSVDEAVDLLQGYNITWGNGPPLHYLIADAHGDSAVIEFVSGQMNIVRNQQPWQLATNFVLSGKSPEKARSLCWRYARIQETLEATSGRISEAQAMALLDGVSQPLTVWSVVYGLTTGNISVAMGGNYEQVHQFQLGMGTGAGTGSH